MGEYFLFTLAAQIVTFPIMVYHFQNFSLVALLANPLVLPPQSLVMILGGLAVLGGLVNPGLGQALAWPFIAYTNRVVEWLASIPHALVSFGATSLTVWIAFYTLLFGLTFFKAGLVHLRGWLDWHGWRALLRRVATPQAALLTAAVLAIFAWSAVYSTPDGRLHLTLFNGGAPGTLLIRTPGGKSVLWLAG